MSEPEPSYKGSCFELYDTLKECVWNILHENPGVGLDEWMNLLIEQYPIEVIDALGTDNKLDAFYKLTDIWYSASDYEDPETGMCHTLQEWAMYFASEQSVELYDRLASAMRKLDEISDILRNPLI